MNLLRNPRVQGTGDAVLAGLMAVSSVVPVLGGDPSWGRPKTLGVVLGLLSTVPVAWRARRPLTVAAIRLTTINNDAANLGMNMSPRACRSGFPA